LYILIEGRVSYFTPSLKIQTASAVTLKCFFPDFTVDLESMLFLTPFCLAYYLYCFQTNFIILLIVVKVTLIK